ncbi:hypothetical protein BD779DRAFT_138653 [Infundibulicybe gibba]|nr:hypothetical protein BD779DRAFT_138653 [Infundibulicybe gibba]
MWKTDGPASLPRHRKHHCHSPNITHITKPKCPHCHQPVSRPGHTLARHIKSCPARLRDDQALEPSARQCQHMPTLLVSVSMQLTLAGPYHTLELIAILSTYFQLEPIINSLLPNMPGACPNEDYFRANPPLRGILNLQNVPLPHNRASTIAVTLHPMGLHDTTPQLMSIFPILCFLLEGPIRQFNLLRTFLGYFQTS